MPRFTYANVMSSIAVFLALGGSAFAAKTYLITSTKQISPKVLKKLKGAQGPRGEIGPAGPAGAAGAAGAAGTATAYGRVARDGTLSNSSPNVTVSMPDTGVYCLTPAAGTSFATKRAVATLDLQDSDGNAQVNTAPNGSDGCAPNALVIETFRMTTTTIGGGDVSWANEAFAFVVP